jgi:hypothetical protein
MADEDEDGGYSARLDIKHERFKALGGGTTVQDDVKALGLERLPLGQQVTDAHRELVSHLAAAGLSNQSIADILGISKERTQHLFKREIGTGFELASATLARSLYWMGVSGDTQAAIQWLRYHNKSQWKAKQEFGGIDGKPIQVETEDKTGKEFLAALLQGMSTDKKLKRPAKDAKREPSLVPAVERGRKRKHGSVVKKVRAEDSTDTGEANG